MAHISDSRHAPNYSYLFQKLGFMSKQFVYAADPPDKQLDLLKKMNPAVIYSYASSMVLLASQVEKQGECPIHPKLIFTTGELLNPDDRELINRAFSVRLRDIFGLVETSDVAWQCPECQGYHLNIDSFLTEVETDGSNDEGGRLTVTNLYAKAMPFIRYEVDDMLTVPKDDPCACGCPFPRIDVIQGRADDWLYSADGHKVSPLIFVIASIAGVMQYRMTQKSLDHLVVEILPGPGFDEQTLGRVKSHVLEVMGNGLRVDVYAVDEIPKESGKLRRVISKVAKDS
jgi:phenylacetate-CoA ligase